MMYSRSLGDVTRREADHLAAEHRKFCDKMIAMASNAPDPTARAATLRLGTRSPDHDEIDRAIRSWVLEQEQHYTGVVERSTAKQMVKDMGAIADFTPVHQRDDRRGSLLTTTWIAETLAGKCGWALVEEGQEKHTCSTGSGVRNASWPCAFAPS